jgi:DNA adenine methylase
MAKPLIPWIGGKRRLAKEIIPLFPKHSCYVEPFCGAAAIFFLKEPVEAEVLNDINADLGNLYRVVKYHLQELAAQFRWVLLSRENFDHFMMTRPEVLTDIQRAARFLYLQKLAFGGKVEGRTFGTTTTTRPKLNLATLEADLEDCYHRLQSASIECRPWEKVVEQYDRPHTLFYCDPPYWQVEGYGVEFGFEQYERLAGLARSIQGTMIISINGHPDIRRVFKGLPVKEVRHQYTVGGSGRSGKVSELVYANRPGLITV